MESLIFVLIEKGILTRNDALSVIQTVAEVKQGQVGDAGAQSAQAIDDLNVLQRLYASFEIVKDRPGVVNLDGKNVRRLRPPLHGDQPEFPHDE
mgnify:CR=1 FL=1